MGPQSPALSEALLFAEHGENILPRFEVGIFLYWTCNSMNNLSSYCGLVDAKIRASDKNLPVIVLSCPLIGSLRSPIADKKATESNSGLWGFQHLYYLNFFTCKTALFSCTVVTICFGHRSREILFTLLIWIIINFVEYFLKKCYLHQFWFV